MFLLLSSLKALGSVRLNGDLFAMSVLLKSEVLASLVDLLLLIFLLWYNDDLSRHILGIWLCLLEQRELIILKTGGSTRYDG